MSLGDERADLASRNRFLLPNVNQLNTLNGKIHNLIACFLKLCNEQQTAIHVYTRAAAFRVLHCSCALEKHS